jgi:hypothetical protein
MNRGNLLMLVAVSLIATALAPETGYSQKLFQRMRDRLEGNRSDNNREDGSIADRLKQRLEDAKKNAEDAAKNLEDRLQGNRKNEDGEPTLADPNYRSNNTNNPATFGSSQPNMLRPANRNSQSPELRGARLQQRGNQVFVTEVDGNSAAQLSGIQRGDVIIELADFPIKNLKDVQEIMSVLRATDQVMLHVNRDNQKEEILLKADTESSDQNSSSGLNSGFAPGPVESGTIGSGAIDRDSSNQQRNNGSDQDQYPNSIRSVLNKVRQSGTTGNADERVELRQEVNQLRDTVERQNRLIMDLQKQLNELRTGKGASNQNQYQNQYNPQLLAPRRTNR